jgi:hypothetical protein
MNSDPEKFETLRKLMALKRHEQPPPEYLHQLSDRIITRIERGEGQLNMWDRFSARFSLRPTMAYAFGLTVCGALGLSAVYMVRQEMAQAADSSPEAALRGPLPTVALASQFKPAEPSLRVVNWLGDTNPIADSQLELPLFNASHAAALPISYEQGN